MTSYDDAFNPAQFREKIIRRLLGANPSEETLATFERVRRVRLEMRDKKVGSFVYYIRLEGRIKIGTTRNLKMRLRDLPWDSVELLECGDEYEERERHKQFAHLRIQGEWFKADDELLHFIEQRRQEMLKQQNEWFPNHQPLPWPLGTPLTDSKDIEVRFMKKRLLSKDCQLSA